MGVLADVYIAGDAQAVTYSATAELPAADRAQLKGFTPLELSILWSLMRGVEWDVGLMDEFRCLLEQDGGQRLIHCFPAAMVAELAALTPDRIDELAPQWGATEELDWPADEAREVIEDLVRLAVRAEQSGRNLYLWNSV